MPSNPGYPYTPCLQAVPPSQSLQSLDFVRFMPSQRRPNKLSSRPKLRYGGQVLSPQPGPKGRLKCNKCNNPHGYWVLFAIGSATETQQKCNKCNSAVRNLGTGG